MKTRLAIYDFAVRYQLDPAGMGRLQQLAGLAGAPPALAQRLPLWIAAMAALLLGLGIVSGVAANWQLMPRTVQFTVLQLAVLLPCAGCVAWPALRLAMGIAAVLATGALLAYLGQTYQTGSDPWQLFALWSVLIFPLCAYVRHDILWSALILLLLVALKLWLDAQPSHEEGARVRAAAIAWSIVGLLCLAFGHRWSALAGSGPYRRLAAAAGMFMLSAQSVSFRGYATTALSAGVASLALLPLCGIFCAKRWRDLPMACAAGLCLNFMAMLSYVRANLFSEVSFDGQLLLAGLTAVMLLAVTAGCIVWLTGALAEVRDE